MKIALSGTFIGLLFIVQAQIEELKQASDKAQVKIVNHTERSANVDFTKFVDPFIGTGGHGHTYPGATAPFGLVQLSPDTRFDGWDGCSGYHYSDSIIYGFSHTHLSGTGVSDYADLLIVPQCGKKAKTIPGYMDAKNGYAHRFSHEQEEASPGFYSVYLPDQKIRVRLTATERAGLHEYIFEEKKGKKFILIDLDHRDQLLGKSIVLEDKQTISGFRISNAWASEQHFYFHMALSKPYEKATYITKNGQYKLLLTFPESTDRISIRVGISGVDSEGAKANLNAEMEDFQFNKYHLATKKKWNEELSKIAITSKSRETETIFYTGMYHAFLQPNIWSDYDGRYRGRDKAIHQLPLGEKQYTVFSLWDTYRAAHPLYTLIQPERNLDFIRTFLRQFDEGGDLPVWELAANETECMIGYHSVSVIADAYAKGLTDFDAEKALQAMIATSNFDEFGKTHFRENGFIGSGDEPESVSKSLEYAYNDFCIAQMAKVMGKMDVYQEYYKRSLNFINSFDPSTKFMRARKGGLWHEPFDPAEVNFNYTEANSWQYSLYAPHAADVLIDLIGGVDSLENWLDRLFTTDMELSGRHQVDITGLIGQYAHGNEPSHHMAYLYNYSSAPHKTQHYVDRILNEMYSTQPDGLSGNEDCGQMSAWYVLSALGLYQVTPGHPWYDFGRPTITEAIIEVNNNNKLKIKTLNNSNTNKYIERITWNGKDWSMNQIHHKTLAEGGELVFYMTDQIPENARQISHSALNSEALLNFRFTPVPFFVNKNRIFDDSLEVIIGHHASLNGENIRIEYRFAEDTTQIFNYELPFKIGNTASIEARRIDQLIYGGGNSMPGIHFSHSPWVKSDFIKKDNSVHFVLKTDYSPQYAASGPNTLIDGVQGGTEFRTGDYQGFWATDIEGIVHFDEARTLSEVGISCLQDMKSWVFYPKSVSFELSSDGVNFDKALVFSDFPQFEEYVGPTSMDAIVRLPNKQVIKAIRVRVENFGECPSWHLGAGNDSWLFLDEIIFR
jgi:predicted alpha-1,2-mannosidase